MKNLKALVLENPSQHAKSILVGKDLCDFLKENGVEAELAYTIKKAELKLMTNLFDLVIIHHRSYEDVDILKRKYPDKMYGAYSGVDLNSSGIFSDEDIIKYMKKMKEHYDFVIWGKYAIYRTLKSVLSSDFKFPSR